MSEITTQPIEELPERMRDPMRRSINEGLMVSFINSDLFGRARLDVRTAIVLYDDAGVFEAAVPPDSWEQVDAYVRTELAGLGVRYYSRGI